VFSGSATLGDQVTEIPVTLDRIPNRLTALSEFVTWELTEVATNRGLVSTQVMMELYFLLRDPGASFAKGIAIEALRDLARLPKQVDEWTPADQQRGPVPLTGNSVASLVNMVFGYNPPRYDAVVGRAYYVDISNRNSITLHLDNWVDAKTDPNALCNCYDLATVSQYYINLYGDPRLQTNWAYMNPFGYLRQTNLVGRGQCNNPFYSNSNYSPKMIVSRTDPKRSAFGNHAFCVVGFPVVVADACAGPHLGTEATANYVAAATDDVFPQPPSVPRGTVGDITYWLGVGSVDMATEMTERQKTGYRTRQP
jgi:hypothetical protein